MEPVLRVGIVGATVTTGGSNFGAEAHVPAIQAVEGVVLQAACTTRRETAEASAEAFGAKVAYWSFDDLVADPDVDMVVVCVRVPNHRELVSAAVNAGKAVMCEWPLGNGLAEAEDMARSVVVRGVMSAVGLQGRSDPTLRHVRDLLGKGLIGDVLAASMTAFGPAVLERGPGRIWQRHATNGANTLTIAGGHSLDALCMLVGEIHEVSARTSTMVREWTDTETGMPVSVTSPDVLTAAGVTDQSAEVSIQVAAVPGHASGVRIEIHGRNGTLLLTAPRAQTGPYTVLASQGAGALQPLDTPPHYRVAGPKAPTGQRPRNVAEAYARFVQAWCAGDPFEPDFNHAVQRHRLIEAIVQSGAHGQSVWVA